MAADLLKLFAEVDNSSIHVPAHLNKPLKADRQQLESIMVLIYAF
jgi:hypothetical protein